MNTIRSEQRVKNTTSGSQIPCVTSDPLRPEDPLHGMSHGPKSYERSTLWMTCLPGALCNDRRSWKGSFLFLVPQVHEEFDHDRTLYQPGFKSLRRRR